jgi:hypothetical protein
LAKIEVFLVSAKLFQALEFSLPEDHDLSLLDGTFWGIQHRPKDYKVIVKKR